MDWTIQSLTRETAQGRRGMYAVDRQKWGTWHAIAPDEGLAIFASHEIDLCKAACVAHDTEEPPMPDLSQPGLSPIPSHSDDRTVNNAVRQTYRVLSDIEKKQMQAIKDAGQEFIDLLHIVGGTIPGADRFASRDLSLANTHIEDAVMRAVRHVTA